VAEYDWDSLTHIEQAFFINGIEFDILPGVFGDLTEAEQDLPLPELAAVLTSLIDRGWIEVHRYERWIADDGREGLTAGDVVRGRDLVRLLGDPASWEYPDDPSWIGAPTLLCTETGVRFVRRSPAELDEV
jgi:hypothetical protein